MLKRANTRIEMVHFKGSTVHQHTNERTNVKEGMKERTNERPTKPTHTIRSWKQPYSNIINDIKYLTLASVSARRCHSIFPFYFSFFFFLAKWEQYRNQMEYSHSTGTIYNENTIQSHTKLIWWISIRVFCVNINFLSLVILIIYRCPSNNCLFAIQNRSFIWAKRNPNILNIKCTFQIASFRIWIIIIIM